VQPGMLQVAEGLLKMVQGTDITDMIRRNCKKNAYKADYHHFFKGT